MNAKQNGLLLFFVLKYFELSEERCYDYIEEQKKIIPQGNTNNFFGNSVAVNKDNLVVGCKFDQENGMNAGAVYIYTYVGKSWVYHIKLLPSEGRKYEEFGNAVALHENVLVVGSQRDNVNGHDSGSVYIFENRNGTWIEEQILTPTDGKKGALFGQHVAISYDTIVVNSNSDSTSLAYIFEKNGDSWMEKQKLKSSGAPIEQHDHPVAIHGNRVVVGRMYDNEKGHQSGSATIFKKNNGKWTEEIKLVASDGAIANWFGVSVAISDRYVVVSSHGDDVNGDGSGSAYVFEHNGENWIEKAKLTPKRGKAGDSFGYPVAIHKEKIIVGCMGDDSAGPGYNSGAVHIFQNIVGNWTEQYKFLPSDGQYNGRFGYSIDMNDEYAAVGSVKFDSQTTGSVYIFNNIDITNKTDILCEVDVPVETINNLIWVLAVSIPLFIVLCCVLFVCICKRVRAPNIEKGEDQAEFIYHDISKSEATVS